MRVIYSIVAIAATLAMGSCGTLRKGTSSQPGQTQPQQTQTEQPKKILYPKNHDSTADYYEEDKGTADSQLSSKPRKGSHYPACKMDFRPIDKEHVRISGVNPLPQSGVLEVNLDWLRDEFCYPYTGEFLSDYGMRGRAMHTGVDIRTPLNDTIRAALPGVVRMSKFYSSYGNIVVIRHYCGFETVYSHFSKNLVSPGDVVEAGTPIGLGGRTGRATTEHVHFEVRAAGEHIDPKKFIDVKNQAIRRGKLYFESHNGTVIGYNTTEERDAIIAGRNKPAESPAPVTNAAVKNKPETASTSGGSASSSTSGAQYHTVKSGDTLYGIALKYKTTVAKLCQLNGIKEKAILSINQKIRVK